MSHTFELRRCSRRSFVFGLVLIASALWPLTSHAERVLEITARSDTDVIRIEQLGVRLLDARIAQVNPAWKRSGIRVRWLEENGYVTGLAGETTMQLLREQGVVFLDKGEYSRPPRRNGGQRTLDELPRQWGWPRLMIGWPAIYGHTTTVADFDRNGDLEVQLSNIENYFYVWQHDGAYYPGYPLDPVVMILPGDPPSEVTWVSSSAIETAALGDIDGDGGREYVYGCGLGFLCAYGPAGSMDGFPHLLDTALYSGVPALVDLDGIEGDEIVLNTYNYFDNWPADSARVHVFYPDHSEMAPWPIALPRGGDSSPAVGDLDGDGSPEIVIGCENDATGPGMIFAWHSDGTPVAGFPITNLYSVNSTPTIADIDDDGYQEILIRVKFLDGVVNGVYAFDWQGNVKPGFPGEVISGHPDGACAVGDLDGDGDMEIAFGTIEAVDLGRIYAWHHDGTPVQGYPQLVNATWVDGSVTIGDVSGDGLPDVIGTTNGVTGDPGHVVAFDWRGQMVVNFPLFPDPNDFSTTFETTPTVLDLDGDGDTEIFAGNWDGKLYCWDSPGLVSDYACWPTLKFGRHRTGCRATEPPDEPSHVRPGATGLAESWSLGAPYPNPFNSRVRIPLVLPDAASANASLTIHNSLGQEVARFGRNQLRSGEVVWNADRHTSGIYFVRLEVVGEAQTAKLLLLK